MKTMLKAKTLFISLAAAIFCVSCANGNDSSSSFTEPNYTIYLQLNNACYDVVSANPIKVERGQEASFDIKLKEDIAVSSLTHQGQEVEMTYQTNTADITTIKIPNIHYSASYTLECMDAEYTIHYYPNGGTYFDNSDASLPYSQHYPKKNRLRPNTELGNNRFYRNGYVLNGWNTSPDGSGQRVGLGSRTSMPENKKLNLYAMWEKESPIEDFTIHTEGDVAYISHYNGHDEKVVVPTTYEGKNIVGIDPHAFNGEEKVVILSSNISNVFDSAFDNSQIRELYFYDNIVHIANSSFNNCPDFSTIHINAILNPRYGSIYLYSETNLADKYDILIENKDKKKLLAFGGSGTYISLNTKTIEQNFPDTVCINMAVNGWFNGVAQFEMMIPYIKEGDTFIHMPESSSKFSLMYDTTMVPEVEGFDYNKFRLFATLEANFDLISHIDYRHVDDLLTGFNAFNVDRMTLPETSYSVYKTYIKLYTNEYHNPMAYIDDRGNWAFKRPALAGKEESGEADIVVEYITDETAHNRLNGYYDIIRDKGVTVYYANAGINRDVLEKKLIDPDYYNDPTLNDHLYYGRPPEIPSPDYPSVDEWVKIYEEAVTTYLNADVLVPISKLLFVTSDFFEPDYHLSDEGSEKFTNIFIVALKERGGLS